MRKGKKIAALSLAGLMAVSALTACSQGETKENTADLTSGALAAEGTGANEAGSSAASGDRVKITVWTENRHDLDYMNKIVEEFNNTNDHIEIEYVVQTENYVNLLSMAANSGQSPDIFTQVNITDFKNFVDNGIVQPINDFITDEFRTINEVDDHLYEGANVMGDEIYWVPCGKRSGSRFIYNKE
ncbi:ABC transporter substrate-binding protein, partial [Hungatella sp.]